MHRLALGAQCDVRQRRPVLLASPCAAWRAHRSRWSRRPRPRVRASAPPQPSRRRAAGSSWTRRCPARCGASMRGRERGAQVDRRGHPPVTSGRSRRARPRRRRAAADGARAPARRPATAASPSPRARTCAAAARCPAPRACACRSIRAHCAQVCAPLQSWPQVFGCADRIAGAARGEEDRRGVRGIDRRGPRKRVPRVPGTASRRAMTAAHRRGARRPGAWRRDAARGGAPSRRARSPAAAARPGRETGRRRRRQERMARLAHVDHVRRSPEAPPRARAPGARNCADAERAVACRAGTRRRASGSCSRGSVAARVPSAASFITCDDVHEEPRGRGMVVVRDSGASRQRYSPKKSAAGTADRERHASSATRPGRAGRAAIAIDASARRREATRPEQR